jgi:hypothetical protein
MANNWTSLTEATYLTKPDDMGDENLELLNFRLLL